MSKGKLHNKPELTIELKKGSRTAFNSLFQDYNQKLYYFALGYLKSEDDAEEVVQETFLKIWERRKDLDSSLSLHSYIFKIAFNFIQKKIIRNLREDEVKHQFTDELVNFDFRTSQMVNYHFLLEHINDLLDKLPPRQKEIIELRKLEGYSLKEIASKLDISVKTVETHLRLALKFLKEKLQSEKFDDLLLFVLTFRK